MHVFHSKPRSASRASALIAVYWVIAILSLAVFTTTQFLMLELETHASTEWEFRAGQFADMGIALAAHPGVERWDSLLRQQVDDTGGFHAMIRSEGARINLNHFAVSENGRIVLNEIFIRWGLDEQGALELVDAITDWIDADDNALPHGAEGNLYRSRGLREQPYNRPFRSLDEVRLVRGFDQVAALQPGWRDAFTLLSSGPLDLNDASPELIQLVCQCGMNDVQRLVSVRLGSDRQPDTQDDVRFQSVDEATNLLGIGAAMKQMLANLVSVGDSATRLISIGTAGGVSVERSLVLSDRDAQPVLLEVQTRVLR
ncbi:MAG: general secretion pathway protein GspK [Verrucomicrobiae bacterium]|nr:general secretion pathway protein GspK [Verrucomicrobiae bacterium]